MTTEREALQIGERVGVGLDAHIAFDRQVGARRAIEEAHIGRDRPRLVRPHRRRCRPPVRSSAMRCGTKSSTEKFSLPTTPTPSTSVEMRHVPRAAVFGTGKA